MMAQLIKNGSLTVDTWKSLDIGETDTPETLPLPEADLLFPLAVWLARKNEIIARYKRIGLLLQPADRVEDVAEDLHYFQVIAVNFPKFVDGRGYSTAALLRQRYQYPGELRAVGDVLHDQLFYLKRVGFDAFALKDGKSAEHALAQGFTTFSAPYQAATDQPLPAFRRRA